jgi:hypothetical protein
MQSQGPGSRGAPRLLALVSCYIWLALASCDASQDQARQPSADRPIAAKSPTDLALARHLESAPIATVNGELIAASDVPDQQSVHTFPTPGFDKQGHSVSQLQHEKPSSTIMEKLL